MASDELLTRPDLGPMVAAQRRRKIVAEAMRKSVARQFSEELHPRVPAGSSGGGRFGSKSTQKESAGKRPAKRPAGKQEPPSPPKSPRPRRKVHIPRGSFGYDPASNHGTGYGSKNGDKHVHTLQQALNRLGFTDMRGRKLTDDGKLGPLTTAAVKKAQRALGVKADGIVSPALLRRIAALKSMPKGKATRAELGIHRKFDPLEARDEHGRWSLIGAALRELAHDLGAVVHHEELGAPGHEHSSHAVVSLHADGNVALHAINEDGTVRIMADGLSGDDLQNLSYAVTDALNTELPEGDGFHSEDVAEVAGFRVTRGRTDDGTAFVSLDTDDDGITFTDEHAEEVVAQLEALGDRESDYDPDNPTTTAPLPTGERLLRRKELGDRNGDFTTAVALVETPDGPRTRLGAISTVDNGIKNWTGGRGKTTVDLDREHAGQVANVLEEFDTAGRERQKVYDRHIRAAQKAEDAGEVVDYNDVSAKVVDELGGDFEDDFGQKKVETPWGTVRLTDVGMDDEANSHHRHVRVEVWPAGMSEEQYDAGNPDHAPWAWPGTQWGKPTADLKAKDIKTLIGLLREPFADPAAAERARRLPARPEGGARAMSRVATQSRASARKPSADDRAPVVEIPLTYRRVFPLEGIEVLSRAKGGDGRTVEAYAAVFGVKTEVHDQHGDYIEENHPTVFNRTISNGAAKRALVLYNHGYDARGKSGGLPTVPLGHPVEIKADGRGLLTISRYNSSEFADTVLASIRNGDITAQSYEGPIYKSTPTRVPKVARGAQLPLVVRMEMGLRNYGPTPTPYYPDAKITAVRSAAELAEEFGLLDEAERDKLIRALSTTPGWDPETAHILATPRRGPGAEDSRHAHSIRQRKIRLRAELLARSL
jgi:phage head maturation protease